MFAFEFVCAPGSEKLELEASKVRLVVGDAVS